MKYDIERRGLSPNAGPNSGKLSKACKVVVVLKRLLISVAASLFLTVAVAAIRFFAMQFGGISFDGPDTFFAFLGFLMWLFPTGTALFFLIFTYRANRQGAAKGKGQ